MRAGVAKSCRVSEWYPPGKRPQPFRSLARRNAVKSNERRNVRRDSLRAHAFSPMTTPIKPEESAWQGRRWGTAPQDPQSSDGSPAELAYQNTMHPVFDSQRNWFLRGSKIDFDVENRNGKKSRRFGDAIFCLRILIEVVCTRRMPPQLDFRLMQSPPKALRRLRPVSPVLAQLPFVNQISKLFHNSRQLTSLHNRRSGGSALTIYDSS